MDPSVLTWNRLEPAVSSEENTEHGFRFAIHDPLWLLTRQWQFGELDGEDAGSAAFISYSLHTSPVQFFGSSAGKAYPIDFSQTPPEMAAEKQLIGPALHIRIEMGRKWIRLLQQHLNESERDTIIASFRQNKKLWFHEAEDFDQQTRFENASLLYDEPQVFALSTLSRGRMLDGWVLYKDLNKGEKASRFLNAPHQMTDEVGALFVKWYRETYGQNSAIESAWQPERMEYQPQWAFAADDGSLQTLSVDEYRGDGINWKGFSLTNAGNWKGPEKPKVMASKNSVVEETVIPSGVRFAGMPSPRLWELEDHTIDFGSLNASETDILKMVFTQFGLVYSNDWLTAPVDLPYGAVCRISTISVTDVFGTETELEPVNQNETCAYFTIAGMPGNEIFSMADLDPYLLKSNSCEKVSLVADEMANMVWGVEQRTEHPLGYSENGYHIARLLEQFYSSLSIENSSQDIPETGDMQSIYQYKLASSVPSNWIPFAPAQPKTGSGSPGGVRKTELQRGALPRIVNGFPIRRIRPRTGILGAADKQPDNKQAPMYIFRDEVPRSGADLSLIWKRIRWFDGSVKVWAAKVKSFGRGEIRSDFTFDHLVRK